MAEKLTLRGALEFAIGKEISSQNLYTELSNRVTDSAAKNVFLELVRQEKEHQDILESYLRGELQGGALRADDVLDYKIVEHYASEDITPDMSLKDIFLRAAAREKTAHDSYLALSQAHSPGKVRTLLEDLASQELTHKQKMEFLYTEVAFPQTAGG